MKGCQMMIGRLVSHPCGGRASGSCTSCGRAMCAHHLRVAGRCEQCLGRYAPPQAPLSVSEGEMMAFDEGEIAAFDTAGPADLNYHGDS